jgi:hypothetical protein
VRRSTVLAGPNPAICVHIAIVALAIPTSLAFGQIFLRVFDLTCITISLWHRVNTTISLWLLIVCADTSGLILDADAFACAFTCAFTCTQLLIEWAITKRAAGVEAGVRQRHPKHPGSGATSLTVSSMVGSMVSSLVSSVVSSPIGLAHVPQAGMQT